MILAPERTTVPEPPTASPIRIYLASEAGAELGEAAIEALLGDKRVEIVGTAFQRIDPVRLRQAEPDVLLSAAHSHMIRRPEREVARLGSVGLHPGLLPRYRGSYPLWWALRNGEREVGLTLYHLVDAVDAGAIIGQRRIPVLDDDTFASLYSRVATEVAPLLRDLVDAIASAGVPEGQAQDEHDATLVRTPARAQRALWKARWAVRRRVSRHYARVPDIPKL